VYTPDVIDETQFPKMRDAKDLPILVTAILEDVDIILTGDSDFKVVDIERPEILSPREFIEKYA
jgi:predicted nucleic acid-binding protein